MTETLLPAPYVLEVAGALSQRFGITETKALPVALAAVRRWADGEGDVPAATREQSRAALLEIKYDTSPVGHGGDNWVTQQGGLPPFLRAVAHALIRNGHSKSSAIAIAVGSIKRWAAGGDNVTAKTRAKAAATIARWEAMKAASHATKSATWAVAEARAGGRLVVEVKAAPFDESAHPRGEAGSPTGGKFVSRGSGYKGSGREQDAKPVTGAQKALIKAGLLAKNAGKDGRGDDGLFGPKTEAAVRAWQSKNGYEPSGKLDGGQYEKLTGDSIDPAADREYDQEHGPGSDLSPKPKSMAVGKDAEAAGRADARATRAAKEAEAQAKRDEREAKRAGRGSRSQGGGGRGSGGTSQRGGGSSKPARGGSAKPKGGSGGSSPSRRAAAPAGGGSYAAGKERRAAAATARARDGAYRSKLGQRGKRGGGPKSGPFAPRGNGSKPRSPRVAERGDRQKVARSSFTQTPAFGRKTTALDAVEAKMMHDDHGSMAGSYEEQREALQGAARALFNPTSSDKGEVGPMVDVMACYQDYIVVKVYAPSGTSAYTVSYKVDGNGYPVLGVPRAAQVRMVAVPAGDDDGDWGDEDEERDRDGDDLVPEALEPVIDMPDVFAAMATRLGTVVLEAKTLRELPGLESGLVALLDALAGKGVDVPGLMFGYDDEDDAEEPADEDDGEPLTVAGMASPAGGMVVVPALGMAAGRQVVPGRVYPDLDDELDDDDEDDDEDGAVVLDPEDVRDTLASLTS